MHFHAPVEGPSQPSAVLQGRNFPWDIILDSWVFDLEKVVYHIQGFQMSPTSHKSGIVLTKTVISDKLARNRILQISRAFDFSFQFRFSCWGIRIHQLYFLFYFVFSICGGQQEPDSCKNGVLAQTRPITENTLNEQEVNCGQIVAVVLLLFVQCQCQG